MLSSDELARVGLIAAAVLAVLLVALSTFGRRTRHPALRSFLWVASVVFLPLTSFVISNLLKRTNEKNCKDGSLPARNSGNPDLRNMWTLLLWIALILIIKGNADTAAAGVAAAVAFPAAGDVSIDGQKVRPPVEHLAQYAFLAYLIVLCVPVAEWLGAVNKAIFIAFCVLGLAKMVLKLVAFWSAGSSFALGKNARLISGYMAQLVEDGEEEGHEQVPRYIVMGERKKHVEESPHGYRIKRAVLDDKFSALVTLDRVWRLSDHGHGLLAERRDLRDLCLSYSLFKSLRRRLSGYPLADAGSNNALDFVLRGMDAAGAGTGDADRVFRVLVDELWFASDFYYSSLPLCSFSGWCAALNHLFSVLIVVGAVTVGWIYHDKKVVVFSETPIYYIITFFLLLVVVLTETWEIVAGVCSNWTKMALLGHYIRRETLWRRTRCAHAALAAVLGFSPARRWRDKMGQNSVLEAREFRKRSGLLSEQIYGRAGLMKSVQVSPAVKDAVLRSLKSIYGRMNKGSTAAQHVGGKVDWAWYGSHISLASDGDGSSTTEYILAWQVGTRLFEIKFPTSASSDKTATCHLSYYCAYLAAAAPELLPDSPAWTDKRYKEVVADVRAALGEDGASESMGYERLVQALAAGSRDKVLRRGADLGRRLVEEYEEDEASGWLYLADFWSEMVLFVAPSENVKGHVEAMARGGEFVTLIWALLLHAGVTTRPETPGSAIP